MDTIQGTLGQALVVLIAMALVLFAIILVLVEADYILGQLQKLTQRWKATRPGAASSGPPTSDKSHAKTPRDGRGAQ